MGSLGELVLGKPQNDFRCGFCMFFAFEIESTQDGKEGAIDLQVQKTSDPFEIRELMTWSLRSHPIWI